eukprot:TRINITY_DN4382_c0_g2_i2.p2 TRINITY_DN4382_c0_g2~~TRINITY_DN4382_c0_g2_i2.p2  ORF type:complete len:110 (+),score=42.89 TRINITY_DN4382_c0_g2_i2:89-418(+)
MCIRDRYQRRVRGKVGRRSMEELEAQQRVDRIFDALDKDSNQVLDKQELVAAMGDDDAADCLSECDADEDGIVTREEWRRFLCALPEAEFDDACSFLESRVAAVGAPVE